MVKAVDDKTSRYVHGGLSTIQSQTNMLTWWDRYNMPKSDDDVSIEITPRYKQSPWLIASDLYGNPSYLWVVLQYNNMLDISEFVIGSTIKLPTPVRLRTSILIKSTGGKTE